METRAAQEAAGVPECSVKAWLVTSADKQSGPGNRRTTKLSAIEENAEPLRYH